MILLLSETPVAGTVARLATWLERLSGQRTVPVTMRNDPDNAFDLPTGALTSFPDWERIAVNLVKQADIIFVHDMYVNNRQDTRFFDIIFDEKQPHCRVFFQYHSAALEPPANCFSVFEQFPFEAVFAVGQGHGRFNRNAVIVPNIVPDRNDPFGVTRSDILFIPHLQSTDWRWSRKLGASDVARLKENAGIAKYYTVSTVDDVFGRPVVTPSEVAHFLFAVAAVLDDINTGLIQQSSIEALKAGAVVFSAADLLSMEEFCIAVDCPPLPLARVGGLEDAIETLSRSTPEGLFAQWGSRIASFSEKYLSEQRLAERYWHRIKEYMA